MSWKDPTAAAIEARNVEHEHLRMEVDRLSRALVDAYTEVEVTKAERDYLRKRAETSDEAFEKGFDQAVDEIYRHFVKAGLPEVAADIQRIWLSPTRTAHRRPSLLKENA